MKSVVTDLLILTTIGILAYTIWCFKDVIFGIGFH